ncbi:hypothetical protein Daura_07355 [Dactylosporangium aurantiacum]|uniref:DUF1345 domain-containing protein n=1 Tax=Dactylosporangium aurantiacum TaxID=35754 RepID=A0A9Q9ILF8_9ACTN|nr:hypothetical protein [Dactylosporangium aurantiacum]MDG6105947.1 hypothetical protein [Dactylosporangium aurantiacum]UWZ56002.1 hypothetical protein Daura_07355 [Dactylosporangium aurantiacum]
MSDLPPAPDPPAPPPQVPGWLRRTEAEQRWPAALAIAVAVGIHLLLPADLAPRPRWLLPGLEAALLVSVVVVNPLRINRETRLIRPLSLGLAALLGVATAWSAALLVRALFGHGHVTPEHLLLWGAAIWLTNVIVFALWFWEGDRGGPAARADGHNPHPDFLFTQMTTPDLAPRDWEPTFFDYLYLSFTNATAFSPTDTLPMSTWAKAGMLAESAVSLVTVLLVVARAVNVIG